MESCIKRKPGRLCAIIFTLCLSLRFVEYFLIGTDKTAVGENVLRKIVGINILAMALKSTDLKWRDIGFQRNSFISGIAKGLLLGSVCFTFSYGLELAILALQNHPAHLELYISSFSLTETSIKNTDFLSFMMCILFNIINVIANCESGLKGEGSKETEDVEGKKGAKKQPPEGRRKGLLK